VAYRVGAHRAIHGTPGVCVLNLPGTTERMWRPLQSKLQRRYCDQESYRNCERLRGALVGWAYWSPTVPWWCEVDVLVVLLLKPRESKEATAQRLLLNR
jgi:hypothetical protein